MILRAAGHGGLVNPLTYGEGKRPMPPWMAAAIGVSIAAHVAGALWLYNQRFVLDIPTRAEGPVTEVTPVYLEPMKPVEPTRTRPPQIDPHTPVDPIRSPIEPIQLYPVDDPVKPGDGPIILPVDPPPTKAGDGGSTGPGDAVKAPPVIGSPKWVRMPTADQMERFYPRGAIEKELGGKATLRCSVTLEGTLTGCSVLSESPAGEGFGAAALKLSRYFRMSPKTVDGTPVEGAVVTVPIGFTLD